jgi:hypothetical protein
MYVNNVGDSRAILVSNNMKGKVEVHALSSDQTPYRKDERFRVMKYGARILSMDQVLQNDIPIDDAWGDVVLGDDIDEAGDPPRVWSLYGDYPGTAFTRSFGDKTAEELGVTAEPEILTRDVLCNDKYVIIASDGVFEFMTNQMVADIVMEQEDPLDACKAIINAAYDLWLRYDVRSDDITVIVLQFVDVPVEEGCPCVIPPQLHIPQPHSPYLSELQSRLTSSSFIFGEKSPAPITPTDEILKESRPVRRALSREKKKKMIFHTPHLQLEDDTMSLAEIAASKLPKTEKDAQAISSAMKSNFLFQHLNSAQKNELISLMQVLPVKAGDWIITQGDIGDKFYLVDNGRFEVRVRAENSEEQNGGNVVHVYDSGNDQHPGFGELALLYNKPRAASVIALTTGKLWFLDYKNFKRTVMRCIYIYIYIFMYMHLYIYKYIKSLVSGLQKLQKNSHEVCICRYVFIYIHIYICIHIYIYI